jgi:hypothetical protein
MGLTPVWKMCQRFLAPGTGGMSITWAEMGMPPCLVGDDQESFVPAWLTDAELGTAPVRPSMAAFEESQGIDRKPLPGE